MDFSPLEGLTAGCKVCGLPIRQDDQATAVMIRVWVPRLGQYRGEGPFHALCGAQRSKEVENGTT